jgi:hypothetical protein
MVEIKKMSLTVYSLRWRHPLDSQIQPHMNIELKKLKPNYLFF